MAKQSRKGKNELDIILEQLKKSYGSDPDQSSSLEDELLSNSHSDEDAELNDLLNMIFENNESVAGDISTNEPTDELMEKINSEVIDQAQEEASVDKSADDGSNEIPENDSEKDSLTAEEVLQEDAGKDVEDSIDVVDSDEISDVPDSLEEQAYNDDEIVEAFAEDTDRMPENTEEASVNDEADQVDQVLDLMFNHKTSTNEDKPDDGATDEVAAVEDSFDNADGSDDINTESYYEVPSEDFVDDSDDESNESIEETVEDYADTNDIDVEVDIDESDDYFNEDDEDNVSFDTLFEDVDDLNDADISEGADAPEDSEFAIEDEEYDIASDIESEETIEEAAEEEVIPNNVITPQIILSSDRYIYDPLQNSSPSFNLPGYEENTEDQTDSNDTSANLAMIDNASFDNNDISLLLKLGYDNEVKSKVGREKAQEIITEQENSFKPEKHSKPFGYCGSELFKRNQLSKIKEKYRSNKINAIILLTMVSIVSALLLAIDIFYVFFSSRIEFFPVALGFEFLFIALLGLILYPKVISGISKMSKFEADSSTLPIFLSLTYLAYLLVALLVYFIKYPAFSTFELNLFGFCISIYAVLDVVSDLLNCIRESNTFNIIESSNEIYVAEKQTATSRNDTGKHRATDYTYRIQKTSLVSGYFKRNSKKPAGNIHTIFTFGVMPAIALCAACAVTLTSNSIMSGLSMLIITLLLGVPFSSLFIFALYEFVVSRWLKRSQTAFIGYDSAEEHAKADMLIFSDRDAVTVTSFTEIVPGKDSEHKSSLDIAFDVFKTLSGTMASACEEHTKKNLNGNHPLIINEITENGIDLYYDNAMNILIGDKYYMKAHKIKVKIDTNLSTAAKGIDRSVIFMAFDGAPKLGFIINSKINSDFMNIVSELNKVNVRSMVETFEPQINDIYFEQNIGNNTSGIGVLKQSDFESAMPGDICSSGIVSAESSMSIAKAVLLSHEIAQSRRGFKIINRIVMIGGITVAIVLSVLYCLGSFYNIPSEIFENTIAIFYAAELLGVVPCIVKLLISHSKHAKNKTEKHTQNE